MEYIIALGLLLIGFAILIAGGEGLVRASVSLATRLKVPAAVIGLTIIAAGTSAPELLTSVLASLQGTPDIALGNVVGSNIFNLLAILGAASILKPNVVSKNLVIFDLPALGFVSLLFYFFLYDGAYSQSEGMISLGVMVIIMMISIKVAKHFHLETDEDDIIQSKSVWMDLGLLTIGLVALIGGAHIALLGGVQIGQLVGLSERVIGVTIISVGTGLPELATSAVAAYRGRDDIAVANVVGSNIMNTLAVAGGAATIKDLPAETNILNFDTPFMLVSTLAIMPLIWFGRKKIHRSSGFILGLAYIGYVIYVL
ncbi:MAG: calcium/sodium antiporter [Bdellovibrionales bacterium]|nr:calcium/sodium antiporter [Bdellovibrionales bacterium]